VKVLIIGLGSIANKHIEAIKRIDPSSSFVALRSKHDAANVAGVRSVFTLAEAGTDFDFVIISNPTANHAGTIEDCLPLQKPLFIEKPLFAETVPNTPVVKAAGELGIPTYVACNLRFHPVIKYLKEYIATQRIEEINIYCGSYLPDWRPGKDFRKIYSANKDMGGGVHLDLIHELDYTYWLCGTPAHVHSLKRNVSSLEINAVDYASYQWLYPAFTANIILNYYRKDARRTIEVVTSNGTVTGNLLTSTVTDHNGNVLMHDPEFTMADTYLEQMKYFLSALETNTIPMNTIEEAFTVLKLALHEETGA
jgi:predicted dehydrogenase